MTPPNLTAFSILTGKCIDDNHPEQMGLFRIEFGLEEGGEVRRCWAESLCGVDPKPNDRILLSLPQNRNEPVILGVIGKEKQARERKPEKSAFEVRENNIIVLKGDQPIQVVTHDGRKLVEIGKSFHGPTIRICQQDAAINLPGTLSISAGELKLQSRKGDIQINADQQVVIEGDLIRLN